LSFIMHVRKVANTHISLLDFSDKIKVIITTNYDPLHEIDS